MNKALEILAHPLSLALLLLAVGVLLWKRGAGARLLCAAALLLPLVFGSPGVANTLLRTLEMQYPDAAIDTLLFLVEIEAELVELQGIFAVKDGFLGTEAVSDGIEGDGFTFVRARAGGG